jgi:hypothetical protein
MEQRRSTDVWFSTLTKFWDWIDSRDIDKHVVTAVILLNTLTVTKWAMHYATTFSDKSGTDIGLVLIAVLGPFSLLQGAAIKWFYDARTA